MTALGGYLAGLQKPGLKWTGPVSSVEPLTVRSGEADIPCVQQGNWTPVVGSEVLVENVAGRAYAMGYVWPHARPDVVEVTDEEAYTPDANDDPVLLPGHLTAEARGHEYKVRYLPSYVPTVGDQVAVSWDTPNGLVIGIAAPAVGVAPPPPPPVAASGVTPVRATDAASWVGGAWGKSEVIQGDYGWGNHNGSWFYGGGLVGVSGATVRYARIRLNRVRGGADYGPGEDIHIWVHRSGWRPGGDVARIGSAYIVKAPLGIGWFELPASMIQTLIDGGSGGLSISGGPYAKFASLAQDPESGLLEITWDRES